MNIEQFNKWKEAISINQRQTTRCFDGKLPNERCPKKAELQLPFNLTPEERFEYLDWYFKKPLE